MTSATNATSAKHCGQQKLIGSSTPYKPKRSRSCRNNPQRFSERRTESGQSEGAPTIGCPYLIENLAPQVGLEPTTLRLTAGCSAIELLRSGSTLRCVLTGSTKIISEPAPDWKLARRAPRVGSVRLRFC